MPPPFDGSYSMCAHVVDLPAGYGVAGKVALITGAVRKLYLDTNSGPGACQRVLDEVGIHFQLVVGPAEFVTDLCGSLNVTAGEQALLAWKPETKRWPPPGQLARAVKKLQEEVCAGDWCMTRNLKPDIPRNCHQVRVWETNQGAAIIGNFRYRFTFRFCRYPCACGLCLM